MAAGLSIYCTGDGDSQGWCERNYIYDVLTGARDINKPLWNPPKIPSWCKVGAWVTRNDCFDVEQVTDIKEGEIAVSYAYDDEAEFYRVFKPVHFRKYKSLGEAEGLLGKKLRFTSIGQNTIAVEIVHTITSANEADLLINNYYQDYLFEHGATIDGLPIGVPVVDEEAMKGGEE